VVVAAIKPYLALNQISCQHGELFISITNSRRPIWIAM
jgi:hypothetical protein